MSAFGWNVAADRKFRFGKYRIRETVWEAIELLDQGWKMMSQTAIHHRTRASMVRLGWAEFQQRLGYIRGRLTPAGIEFRDQVYVTRATRLDDKIRRQLRKERGW